MITGNLYFKPKVLNTQKEISRLWFNSYSFSSSKKVDEIQLETSIH